MYQAYQASAWDHTAMLLASWSSKSVHPDRLNPYRRRRSRGYMRPVELYALRDALEQRNAGMGGA